MRTSVIILAAALAVLVAISFWQGTFSVGLRGSLQQVLRFLPILIIALLVAGFAEALLPEGFVEHWLSDSSGWRGIGLAYLAGVLTPGGSIMGLPLVAAFYKVGVGVGVLVTYMTSLATLSLLRVPLEVGFYGWRLTALRIVVSLALPPIAGVLAQLLAHLFVQR